MRVKCQDCFRHYNPDEQMADFASYTTDHFVVTEVFRPLMTEFGTPRVWEIICLECFRKRIDTARDSVEGQTFDSLIRN